MTEPMTDALRGRLLTEWNDTARPFDAELSLHGGFELQAARAPQAIAVVLGDRWLSYGGLDEQAECIASFLRAAGVSRGSFVGVCLQRSLDLLPALLGVLKTGAAYVPLDPEYPAERLAHMLADSGCAVVLTRSALRERVPASAARVVCLDTDDVDAAGAASAAPAGVRVAPADLAYVLYTSGSTGKPKGVLIPHQGISNHVQWVGRLLELSPADRVLHYTSISFDASLVELFAPLAAGATVVMALPDRHKDPAYITRLVAEQRVTSMQFVPSFLRAVLQEPAFAGCDSLRHVICGGEALPWDLAREFLRRSPARLSNCYGPTETSVDATSYTLQGPHDQVPGEPYVPIGRPIANATAYVLDAALQLVPPGQPGELYIGGRGLAQGYLNRPEQTAERFVAHPFVAGEKLYRTGDLVRQLDDGRIAFIGRVDHQVKLRGFRIELGEIEAALNACPGVRESVTVVREDRPGVQRLVAYVVGSDPSAAPDPAQLRGRLKDVLTEYMVPSVFMVLPALPLLPNGKMDRNALPVPGRARPALMVPFQAALSPLEQQVVEAFAEALDLDEVGRLDNFFDLGGTSLLATQVLAAIALRTGLRASVATIFAHPTPASLAADMQRESGGTPQDDVVQAPVAARRRTDAHEAIAVIAMAGRFPGAGTVEAFWDNLLQGKDSITHFSVEQLDASVPAALRADPQYVRARGVMDGVDQFDAAFFGMPVREAEATDPQQRIFLELAWECLERGGYAPDRCDRYDRAVGVFAGVDTPTYLQRNVWPNPKVSERLGEIQVVVGNDKDYIATRVAYKLNLKGPAIAVNTACSTSLVAVAQAVEALRSGRCAMALAGGASMTSPPNSGYLYQEGSMLSPDGCTRTFDADARGTVFNDGAAVVLLKPLTDALADGDTVYAVIRGVGLNNDGGGKASFTAPSVEGQAAVVMAAHADAGVDPATISYVEAHGTATPLGDPVEVEALTRAFRRGTSRKGFCRIGSVKSNIGHLVTAAGATGLIKTALALAHEKLPATIHYKAPNPRIDFGATPFVVNDRLVDWPRAEAPRRAGVSSFGIGGTNAHVVVEEAPLATPSDPATGPQVLMLSAPTRSALDAMARQLADRLDADPAINLADAAYTLRVGRSRFGQRLCVVGTTAAEAAQALRDGASARRALRTLPDRVPSIVFVFPGQGAQYAGMGRGLYESEPAFRAAFDDCLAALEGVLDFDLKQRVFDGQAADLSNTATTQPATFCLEYALARLWQSRGLQPSALIGHSVGEFVAAVLAGVMPLADAVRLVARRGQLMQALPGGSMLSVRMAAASLEPQLPAGVALAAENGPTACVAAGPTPAIEAWRAKLEADGVMVRLLQTSHAFHSPMMDAAVAPFEALVRGVQLAAPNIPIVSTLTGSWMAAGEATDPRYWARHLREPVRFSPAVRTALAQGACAFLEVGPRGTLSTLVRQHTTAGRDAPVAIATLGDSAAEEPVLFALATGSLWSLGLELPQPGDAARRRRIVLPTYPFERKRFWIDTVPAAAAPLPAPVLVSVPVPAVAVTTAVPAVPASLPSIPTIPAPTAMTPTTPAASARHAQLVTRLVTLFEDVAGLDLSSADAAASFVELGLDSLALTQAALQIKKAFSVSITFRQLMEQHRTLEALAGFLEAQLPADPVAQVAAPAAVAPVAAQPIVAAPVMAAPAMTMAMPVPTALPAMAAMPAAQAGVVQQLIAQQMQLMAQQLALLGMAPAALPVAAQPALQPVAQPVPAPAAAAATAVQIAAATTQAAAMPAEPVAPLKYDVKKAFGAIARIHTAGNEMTERQRVRLDALMRRYEERTPKSKAYTVQHRSHLADPRVVNGFRPQTKEMVYQIVMERSKGARMWDLDGNEYIDILNGFGMCLFGWQPDFVQDAVRTQLERGYDIGPMHPLAGEVAKLVCELTGFDRAGLVNTGSEAVMAAMRIARTVTGRNTIVLFAGSYHGTFDEVIVRAGRNNRGIPAAPGIMPGMYGDVVVLDYGTPQALEYIRSNADDLAAVLVEPVQSRRPEFQPREFLKEVREITSKSGTCLIFDEVIMGFRSHPAGCQGAFGIQADLGTYGKVIGGGMPIGVVAGKREFMDALDGGSWQYGDDSMPTVGVTYFAGTFVRHPLAMAAAKASLEHLRQNSPRLQDDLNARTGALANELNAFCREQGAPVEIRHYSSLFRITFTEDHPFQDLLFAMMRSRGIHALDNFPCFLTTAHGDVEIAIIKKAFKESIVEMIESEFFPRRVTNTAPAFDASKPPAPNARLGRDADGKPAWFVPHPEKQGKFIKLDV